MPVEIPALILSGRPRVPHCLPRQRHALAQREHNADRWIAATAVRLGIPLVSNDGIFRTGLALETLSENEPGRPKWVV